MSRFLCATLALTIVLCGTRPVMAQVIPTTIILGKPAQDPNGIESARFTGPEENFLERHLRLSGERAFDGPNLQMYSERFLGLEPYEVTSLNLALEEASAAATLGLFTGAAANTLGLWDEDTSWYITGAAAALGAFLGFVQGERDPASRVRYRWNIDANSSSR